MTRIEVKVTDAHASAQKTGVLTCGMVGAVVTFDFNESWTNLSKTAVFKAGSQIIDVLNVSGDTVVPWEQYAFSSSAFARVPPLDARGRDLATQVFHFNSRLHTVDEILVDENTKFNVNYTFAGTSALVNIKFTGTIAMSVAFQWSTKLSHDSIVSIITHLSDTATGMTATFSKTAVNNAFETSSGAADGTSSEEWAALIATKSNWTISLV